MRFRKWLRENTHWKNADEFFTALLFENGPPPCNPPPSLHPRDDTGAGDYRKWYADYMAFSEWRDRIALIVSTRTHHSIDPSQVVEDYIKWLCQKIESGNISLPS